jgi:phosphomannomutase / phosphoglucomutase
LSAIESLDYIRAFRTYDVRGIYGSEVTEDLASRMGLAFGSWANGGKVSLGRDTRISGPSLEMAFSKGTLETGCEIYSYGVIPIAILSYITRKDEFKAAAYISASHNPPEYNGIRFRSGEGHGLLYQETDIMKFYRQGNFISGKGKVINCLPDNAIERYRRHVSGKIHLLRKLKVVLDMGNGSACIMDSFYRNLGFETVIMHGEMDGRFPGRGPAPNDASLRAAARKVVQSDANYGVGFDPDADRGIIIDEKGRIIPPEKVAIIVAKCRYKPGDLVISGFDCSMILERELNDVGIKVERVRVGDVFIANRVKNSGAVLGVERSGHFFLPEFQYSDDPFAMSLALGEIVSQGERLSMLADRIPDYPYLQKSIHLKEDPAGVMMRLKEALARQEPDTTDGLKITTEGYSILIRPSNTEPLLRLYIETIGEDIDALEKRYDQIIRAAMKS